MVSWCRRARAHMFTIGHLTVNIVGIINNTTTIILLLITIHSLIHSSSTQTNEALDFFGAAFGYHLIMNRSSPSSYWISITWVLFCFSLVFILTDHYVQMLATLNATLYIFSLAWSKSNGEWVSGDNIRKECCRTCFIGQRNSRSKLWLLPL